jgi:thiamine-phosphate pyrophosphorylase
MHKFKLIVLADASKMEHRIQELIALFGGGLECLHLRTADFPEAELEILLKRIPSVFHNRIVLHGHYALAIRLRLKGIHLTEKTKLLSDTPGFIQQARALQISGSFHSFAALNANTLKYDYVFLSPVFDSISKAGYNSGFDLTDLQTFLAGYKQSGKGTEVIALGGIDAASIAKARAIGFDGAALYGALWEETNPPAAFKSIQAQLI